ncbi:MAG: HEPN domain-containing protein [Endomicrobium sp.]|jgi:HEPN domain-containing protein|nr:HEPN domain-containing protein [Endomicrobium sp.]
MNEDYNIWLTRAKSSLALSKMKTDKDIVYEDLCFQAQQAVEKSLKALLIFYNVDLKKTHNLITLIKELSEYIEISDKIKECAILNDYAVQTRYPGDYTSITKEEYDNAVQIAQNCVKWVRSTIKALEKESKKNINQPLLDNSIKQHRNK